ncbi:hypothetical protein VTJ04DRAFT_2526 [Mycothermus thermophilus]|uniref:uncharacterized protein n=1 Tax=Humicola insolens TaxID=85995 RepID=UPI0037438427
MPRLTSEGFSCLCSVDGVAGARDQIVKAPGSNGADGLEHDWAHGSFVMLEMPPSGGLSQSIHTDDLGHAYDRDDTSTIGYEWMRQHFLYRARSREWWLERGRSDE